MCRVANNFADYIVDAILRFIFRIRTCFARIYFCVDILEHCRISLLSIVAEKKIRWRPFFRRLNVVVYILEIYLVTDEIYLKSIIIGSRLDYSL